MSIRDLMSLLPLMAPEGEGGGGAPGDAGAGGDGGNGKGGEGGGQPGGDGPGSLADAAARATFEADAAAAAAAAANTSYRPAGLPDHLLGASERETIDNLYKAFDGFRDQASRIGAVPEKPSSYAFEASDKLQPYMEALEGDKMMEGARAIFHAAGVTDKQYAAVMPKMLELMIDEVAVEAPVDFNKMIDELVPHDARGLAPDEQNRAVSRRITEALAYLDGIKSQHGFDADPELSDKIADFLVMQLGNDPRGIRAIEQFQRMSGRTAPAMNGGTPAGALSDGELERRITDPRYDPRSLKFDRGFQEETDRLWRQRHGV
ncbi:MAG TPA: hypothetical protein VGA50_17635 [Kiloniellales bacterium]|jgi:hypothetical protein